MTGACQDLLFPLNVYAALLSLDFGMVEALHFGIFSRPDEDLPQAQARATDLLLAHLPSSGCGRMLEVGSGLGATLRRLLNQGYDILAVNPDPVQVELSRKIHAIGRDRLLCERFEAVAVPPESLACVFFQESAQYIEPVVLLQRCADLLVLGGRVVVMDEFRLRCDGREPGRLPQLGHFLAHAGRCGFSVSHRQDLGHQAMPTIGYLRDSLHRYRRRLATDLNLSPATLDSLAGELETLHAGYRDGRFGYALICLEKIRQAPYRVLPGSGADVPAVRKLFGEVFSHDLSPAVHAWKYGSGRGRSMLVWSGDTLVGHYGGVERRILFRGRPERAVQIGDVMVAAPHRQRKGPFWLACRAFAESYVGNCAPWLLAFGFPNARAMRLGRLLDLYAPVDAMVQLTFPPAPSGRPLLRDRLLSLSADSFAAAAEPLDRLWEEMAADWRDRIIGVRDAAYLRHRYLEHPAHEYRLIMVRGRFSGRVRGLLVFRPQDGDLLLVDLLGRRRDLHRLVVHARRVCRIEGGKQLRLWITQSCAVHVQGEGCDTAPLDIVVPMISCVPGPPCAAVRDRWWLMAGDMDFM